MKKKETIIVILMLCLLAFACQQSDQQTAPTSPSPQAGLILFSDDFQDGQLDGWQVDGDWMIYQDGDVYNLGTQGAGSAWVPGGNTWTDYALKSYIRQESGSSLSINFRLSPDGRYIVNLRDSGIYLAKEQPGGTITTLLQNDPPAAGIWHYMTIAGEDELIQVYVDRQLVLSYQDPDPLTRGTIGFAALSGSRAYVDNLVVNQLEADLQHQSVGWSPTDVQSEMEFAGPALENVLPPDSEFQSLPAAPQPAPAEPVQVAFTVEGGSQASIEAGQCVTVEWNVENASEIYYQGGAVSAHEARDECPGAATTYVLEAVSWSQQVSEYTVTVTVSGDAAAPSGGGVDLHLMGVSIQAAGARVVGHELAVGVNLQNNGSAAAGAFTVHWYPMNDGVVGCSWDVGALAPGETVNLTCVYPGYPAAGSFQWAAAVDVESETGDANPNNNRRSGDITIRPAAENESVLAPVNCRVESTGQHSIGIAWDVMGQAEQEGFKVYQAVSSLETIIGPTTRSVLVENLEPNIQYHFDVRAYGWGMESNPDECAVDATTAP